MLETHEGSLLKCRSWAAALEADLGVLELKPGDYVWDHFSQVLVQGWLGNQFMI